MDMHNINLVNLRLNELYVVFSVLIEYFPKFVNAYCTYKMSLFFLFFKAFIKSSFFASLAIFKSFINAVADRAVPRLSVFSAFLFSFTTE